MTYDNHPSHPPIPSNPSPIHQQRSKRWQKDDKKMTERWQKDDRKMSERSQRDDRRMTDRCQKDKRNTNVIIIIKYYTLYHIIIVVNLKGESIAISDVIAIRMCLKASQENFIFKPTSPLNDNHQETETCTVKKRRRRWCCWEACAILKLHWRYTRHLVGWPSSDIKNKFFDSLLRKKCITDPLIQPILIGSDECKTVD